MPGPTPFRVARWIAAATVAAGLAVLPTGAHADTTTYPETMSTTAINTSRFDIPVPEGVTVRAITGVLTMPEVVEGGQVGFHINGRVAEVVESSLYQKVRVPVVPSDVVADGTIALKVVSVGPATATGCRPGAGEATLRRLGLIYRGTETPPTTLAGFFPPAAERVDVVIPPDADDDLLEAGLTAVGALASRYPDDTAVELVTAVTPPTAGTANRRVVALVPGRPGEVTTDISTTGGVPMLTLTGVGDELTGAARALSSPALGLAGEDSENLAQELANRAAERTQSLADLGAEQIALSGYGTTTHTLDIPQDAFGTPVSELDVHLEGSHTAVSGDDPARLDVTLDVSLNGALVGSTVLGEDSELALDFTVPAGRLRAVNEFELTLHALAPDGSPCAVAGAPTIDVDVNTVDSTITATRGAGEVAGFQLYPQVFEGTLPVAVRPQGARRPDAAVDAAVLIAALQRAAAYPLEIQLIHADTFLADDRSGLFVGATASDSTTLEAPLRLSATRLVETEDSTFEVSSQEPYAVLESVRQPERSVVMLGSWAPGDVAAPANLSHHVTTLVTQTGWADLDGDLVIADDTAPAFAADSGVTPPEADVEEERSYVRWFVIVIVLVLLLIAVQVVLAIRRDRRVARTQQDEEAALGDAASADTTDDLMEELDDLADVDDETPADEPETPQPVPAPVKQPVKPPVKPPAKQPATPPAKQQAKPPVKRPAKKAAPPRKSPEGR